MTAAGIPTGLQIFQKAWMHRAASFGSSRLAQNDSSFLDKESPDMIGSA
jgi:hypothetical protein